VDVATCDLRNRCELTAPLDGVDAVIHLAASVTGSDDQQFMNTVVGTENLLDAMAGANVDRLVLCSSFSVYDWQRAGRTLDEDSPLEADRYARDGYGIAKIWQEELVRRYAEKNHWRLTVLRPGFLWGQGNELISATGHSVGRWHIVVGGLRELPISYVENCAECIAIALDHPAAVGETYNVVDSERISAWRFAGDALRSTHTPGYRVYVPYWLGLAAATVATWIGRLFLGPAVKLPGLLVPIRYRARFRPLHFTSHKAQLQLNWNPRYTFTEAWQRIADHVGAAGASFPQSAAPASPKEVAVE
jgi:UDP-glucose 4-epimerase